MCAFYQHDTLMARPHGQALKHIIEMVLSEPGSNDSMIVPIVIHFDEHSKFIRERNKLKDMFEDGKSFVENMLRCIGSAATSRDGAVSDLKCDGRFFLVPIITTGTSHQDANILHVNPYGITQILECSV